MNRRPFTKEEVNFLKEHYEEYACEMRLDDLADKLQRTRTTICKKASQLGLTNKSRRYLRK